MEHPGAFSLFDLRNLMLLIIQEALPPGATTLGVVLSSDKTNISIMSRNRMAHPVLISLANIDACIRSKTSLHAYLLLALLPIAKFTHKDTRVHGFLQDRLVHQSLDIVLAPLKTAARVGIMMNDPAGNLRYCYMPLASWIADMPEESLLAATGPKASPVTIATSKNFGDAHRYPLRTGETTLRAIHTACEKHSPTDYKNFIRTAKSLFLNGVTDPCWKGWLLSDPSKFLTPEMLHHFHRMFWDHDIKWCVHVIGAAELDFRFSLIQTPVGYRAFDEGISKLKQVTGRDHRAIQRYLIGVIAGKAPSRFLTAVRFLLDFRYLAQAPIFTDHSLDKVTAALQGFHDHKDAVISLGARAQWEIPKLELLQSVVPSIHQSGATMQWLADITEHAHVDEIKVPARAGNNQNYYSQIARHLDRLEKWFRFDLATYIGRHLDQHSELREDEDNEDDEDEPDPEAISLAQCPIPTRPIIDYFAISSALQQGHFPSAPHPFRTLATATTAFHLATKPSARLTVSEAAAVYGLTDLAPAISAFFAQQSDNLTHGNRRLQVWYKLRVQQMSYHTKTVEPPQTLRAMPPSAANPHGLYDSVIVSPLPESNWPKSGLNGHSVVQLRLIFRDLESNIFAAYVQRFNTTPRSGPHNTCAVMGMHMLKRAVRANGQRIGEVIPLTLIHSGAHLIPNFGPEAHLRLTKHSSYEFSSEFWLNKYWSKETFFALSSV